MDTYSTNVSFLRALQENNFKPGLVNFIWLYTRNMLYPAVKDIRMKNFYNTGFFHTLATVR